MPSHASVPSTLPAPATIIMDGPEGVIGGTKITPTRSGTVTHLSAFVNGQGGGGAATQGGKLSIYSHNGGTPGRPLTKLGETAEFVIPRSLPVTGIGYVPLLVPVPIVAGTIYWVCLQTPTIGGQGIWQVRGITGGGDSVFGVAQAYATVPAAFPAGGAASTNRASLGVVFTPSPHAASGGAIVGTFIVGDGTLVGEQPSHILNEGVLKLNGKAFLTFVFTDIDVAQPGKPKLILKGKPVVLNVASAPMMGKPALILNGEQFFAITPIQMHMGKPWLTLRGKAFVIQTDSSPVMGKPKLFLLGGDGFTAKVPGLVPTVPIDIDLVPTVPQNGDLVPTTPESLDLVPTTEEFR